MSGGGRDVGREAEVTNVTSRLTSPVLLLTPTLLWAAAVSAGDAAVTRRGSADAANYPSPLGAKIVLVESIGTVTRKQERRRPGNKVRRGAVHAHATRTPTHPHECHERAPQTSGSTTISPTWRHPPQTGPSIATKNSETRSTDIRSNPNTGPQRRFFDGLAFSPSFTVNSLQTRGEFFAGYGT
ncbi:hypothetical protein B0H14DRAFT_2583798 [Mycena olivaceomarginata]|nr:hypothetical protein B0H14DRAFT_2583798 [Mycena olivaceomarginata]